MRRATRYVPPASQVAPPAAAPAPAATSAGWTQTWRSSRRPSSALRLAVPSLNPNRLRGVTWARVVDEVRPKPSWDQRTRTVPNADPGQVADGVHRDLRVVGAGLDHDVAVGARVLQVVAREVGQRDERVGQPVGQPEAVDRGVRRARRTANARSRWSRSARRPAGPWPHRCPRAARRRGPRSYPTGRRPGPGSSGRPSWSSAGAGRPGRHARSWSGRRRPCTCGPGPGVTMPAWWTPRTGRWPSSGRAAAPGPWPARSRRHRPGPGRPSRHRRRPGTIAATAGARPAARSPPCHRDRLGRRPDGATAVAEPDAAPAAPSVTTSAAAPDPRSAPAVSVIRPP